MKMRSFNLAMLKDIVEQACIKVFGAWDPKKVPGNARKEYA